MVDRPPKSRKGYSLDVVLAIIWVCLCVLVGIRAYDVGKRAGEADEKPCAIVDQGYVS